MAKQVESEIHQVEYGASKQSLLLWDADKLHEHITLHKLLVDSLYLFQIRVLRTQPDPNYQQRLRILRKLLAAPNTKPSSLQ